MRRVSALTFTNAHFAHFYAQKGPFPKPQVKRKRQPRKPNEDAGAAPAAAAAAADDDDDDSLMTSL